MTTRSDVISDAINRCLEELYSVAQPSITYEEFKEQCKIYSKKCREWEEYNRAYYRREENPKQWEYYKQAYKLLEWEGKTSIECIGPSPIDFYYVPDEVQREISEYYISSYRIDEHQNLVDIIEILKKYCKEPIIDKYIDDYIDDYGNHHPGHRSYEYSDNLKIEIKKKLEESPIISVPPSNKEEYYNELSEKLQDKFFEFLDMAENFFSWNHSLNTFKFNVFNTAPSTNKEKVIENWKKYRGKDIEIDESKYKEEYDDDLF